MEVKAGETFSKNYTLPPVYRPQITASPVYTLRISTLPEGADVKINNSYKGKTPLQVELQKNRCRLRIEKGEEWAMIDESIELKTGPNTVNYNLKRIKYRLSIKTNPTDARVSIGNELFGITPVEKLISIGVYKIKIEKQGHRIVEESINVDSDIAKVYDLIKVQKGKLRIKVQPFADVFIDGRLLGEVPPIRVQELEEGKHIIEFVSTRLNKKYSVDVEIGPGESKEIRMNMETGKSNVIKVSSIQKK